MVAMATITMVACWVVSADVTLDDCYK